MANVMMKINLKLAGRNHTVSDSENGDGRICRTLKLQAPKRSVMVLGADVGLIVAANMYRIGLTAFP
jgi:hypothetical protein